MKRLAGMMAALGVVVLFAACATPAPSGHGGARGASAGVSPFYKEGVNTYHVKANAIIFHQGGAPPVREISFVSRLTVSKKSVIHSFRFDNFISSPKKADNSVLLALSGPSAGFGIYDWSGAPLAEYGQGQVKGVNMFFRKTSSQGRSEVRWTLGSHSAVSIIDTFDTKGILVHSEITTYRVN